MMGGLTVPWTQKLWDDLQPTPGRLDGALRIVLATVLTLIFLVVWRVPFASVGLFFVFLVGRDSPSVSVRSGILAIVTLAFAVATELGVIILTDNDPMARLVSVSVVAFLAALLSVSTSLAAFPPIWGFIFCTLIALWETPLPPGPAVKNSLWLLAAGAIPIVCSVAVEYVFASRSPVERLLEQRNMRYRALGEMFGLYAQGPDTPGIVEARSRVNRLAAAGQEGMRHLYNAVVDRNLYPGKLPVAARARINMLAQLMDLSAAFASQAIVPDSLEFRARCDRISRASYELMENFSPKLEEPLHPPSHGSLTVLDRVEQILGNILSMPSDIHQTHDPRLVAIPSKDVPLLQPGALTDKNNVAFALKISLCATVCYILYFALSWPGIATSVTTVFITGLTTTGAIKQKFTYRLLGSMIGGLVFGIGSAVFLFPEMDTIASLSILVAFVALIAAWFSGGRVFNYIGLQIAFSFYLVALEGFRAPTELAPARDRLIGILLALVVMWFVFDQMWPVRTITAMRRTLSSVLRNGARLFHMGEMRLSYHERRQLADSLRDTISKAVARLRVMNDEIEYEFGVDRHSHARSGEAALEVAFDCVALFWNELAMLHDTLHEQHERSLLGMSGFADMRRNIAVSMERMADSVAKKEPYSEIDAHALVDHSVLGSPGYVEYANNISARFEQLQESVVRLGTEV